MPFVALLPPVSFSSQLFLQLWQRGLLNRLHFFALDFLPIMDPKISLSCISYIIEHILHRNRINASQGNAVRTHIKWMMVRSLSNGIQWMLYHCLWSSFTHMKFISENEIHREKISLHYRHWVSIKTVPHFCGTNYICQFRQYSRLSGPPTLLKNKEAIGPGDGAE